MRQVEPLFSNISLLFLGNSYGFEFYFILIYILLFYIIL